MYKIKTGTVFLTDKTLRTPCESTGTSIPQRQIQQCFLQTQFSQYRYWSGRNNYHHSSSRCTFIFIQSKEQNSHKQPEMEEADKVKNLPVHHFSTPYTTPNPWLGVALWKPAVILLKHSSEIRKGHSEVFTISCGYLEERLSVRKWLRNSNFSYTENVWELFLKLTLGLWLLLGSQWTQSESLHLW